MILLLALAQIIVCSDQSCGSTTNKDAANVQPNDLVEYCVSGTQQQSQSCTTIQPTRWTSMNPSSWVFTTDGWYRVSDVPSASAPTPPPITPTPPTTTPVYDIAASWTDPVPDAIDGPATDYQLFYGLAGSSLTSVHTGNVLAYTVKSPPPGYYEVHIVAFNKAGPSALSNAAYVQISAPSTPVTPPVTPPTTNYTVTPGVYTPKKGSSNIGTKTFVTIDDCHAFLGTQPAGTYSCAYSGEKVVVK